MPLFVGKGLETIPLKWTPDDLETKPMRKTGFLYGSGQTSLLAPSIVLA